jgi:uncharacterized membrane protein YeaQ/YmgE (transglycosylase-associated protein family)
MLHFIGVIIVGVIIGIIAGAIVGKGKAMGFIAHLAAGLVGSWLGTTLLGNWGPHLFDIALIPAIIGAIIVVFIVGLIFKNRG